MVILLYVFGNLVGLRDVQVSYRTLSLGMSVWGFLRRLAFESVDRVKQVALYHVSGQHPVC